MLRSTLSHLTLVPNDIPDSGAKASARTGRIWIRLRKEAEEAVVREPMLARLFFDSIINQPTLEEAVAHRIGSRLHNDVLPSSAITYVFRTAMAADRSIGEAMRADIRAVVERDPACDRFIEPFLYYKGFHAIQTQRLAHWLWNNNGRDFALYLQSRSSSVFQTDIHPASKMGKGIFIDHATGLVVGETARAANWGLNGYARQTTPETGPRADTGPSRRFQGGGSLRNRPQPPPGSSGSRGQGVS